VPLAELELELVVVAPPVPPVPLAELELVVVAPPVPPVPLAELELELVVVAPPVPPVPLAELALVVVIPASPVLVECVSEVTLLPLEQAPRTAANAATASGERAWRWGCKIDILPGRRSFFPRGRTVSQGPFGVEYPDRPPAAPRPPRV
jgi:hypothetical protein